MAADETVKLVSEQAVIIEQWKVRVGDIISRGSVLFSYKTRGESNECDSKSTNVSKYRSDRSGTLRKIIASAGELISPNCDLAAVDACTHPTVMKDLCAECGADLRQIGGGSDREDDNTASVAMLHSIPELRVSRSQAKKIGRRDMELLLKNRKLVLLVDLDQTLVHTTNDDIPPNLSDVFHFQLYGAKSPWYHTRLRPGTRHFLERISSYYEMHVCTFGTRLYAHTITSFLDPKGAYFSHRILSRDECFSPHSKTANLKSLFPCGEHMVCIIDDREDVWNFAPNLVQVMPYHFFKHTGDINAPPGLEKSEKDDKEGFDFDQLSSGVSGTMFEQRECDVEDKNYHRRDSMPNLSDDEEDSVFRIDGDPSDGTASANTEIINELNADLSLSEDEDDRQKSAVSEKQATTKHSLEDITETEEYVSGKEFHEEKERSGNKSNEIYKSDYLSEQIDNLKNVTTKDQEKFHDGGDDDAKRKTSCCQLDVPDHDDYLMHLEDILVRIHTLFYSIHDKYSTEEGRENFDAPDLRYLVPHMHEKVLNGVRLVFSGVVPSNTNLTSSQAYHIATSLGAIVQESIVHDNSYSSPSKISHPSAKSEQHLPTTHVVGARWGTAKTNEAQRSRRIRVVSADWLWSCAERWEWVDERLFPLTVTSGSSISRLPPYHYSGARASRFYPQQHHEDCSEHSKQFQETFNPLLSFSPDDIARMDEEVEDILQSDSADDEENRDVGSVDRLCAENRSEIINSKCFKVLSHARIDKSFDNNKPISCKRPAPAESDESCDDDGDGNDDFVDDEQDESPSVKFRRGGDLPSDDEMGGDGNNNSEDDDHSPDLEEDWSMMGAELERELGSDD